MKAGALVLAFAFLLTGCVGGSALVPPAASPLAPLQLTAPVTTVDDFADATAVGSSNAGPVLPLFAIPGIATNYGTLDVAAWGTKNAAGTIGALQEIAVYGLGAGGDSASVFFDTSGRVASILDHATGYSVELTYGGASHVSASLCDPSLSAVATVTAVAASDGTPQGEAVAGGTCVHENGFALQAATVASAAPGVPTNLAGLPDIASRITAGSYVAGAAFAIAALLKYKQHKDNPTQTTIGTPIALLFIAAALLFIPSLFPPAPTVLATPPGLSASAGVPPFVTPP